MGQLCAAAGAGPAAAGGAAAKVVLGPPATDAPRVELTVGEGSSTARVARKNEPHESLPLLGWRRSNLRRRGEFQKLGR